MQYWNMMYGFTENDVRHDIKRIQTMCTLRENMVLILKCMDCAKR